MDFIVTYWPQLVAFLGFVVAFTTLKIDVITLKEKVKTLFDLYNKEK